MQKLESKLSYGNVLLIKEVQAQNQDIKSICMEAPTTADMKKIISIVECYQYPKEISIAICKIWENAKVEFKNNKLIVRIGA